MEHLDPVLKHIEEQQKQINTDSELIKKKKEPINKVVLVTSVMIFFVLFFGLARMIIGLM